MNGDVRVSLYKGNITVTGGDPVIRCLTRVLPRLKKMAAPTTKPMPRVSLNSTRYVCVSPPPKAARISSYRARQLISADATKPACTRRWSFKIVYEKGVKWEVPQDHMPVTLW